jgi:hypothetical protein
LPRANKPIFGGNPNLVWQTDSARHPAQRTDDEVKAVVGHVSGKRIFNGLMGSGDESVRPYKYFQRKLTGHPESIGHQEQNKEESEDKVIIPSFMIVKPLKCVTYFISEGKPCCSFLA